MYNSNTHPSLKFKYRIYSNKRRPWSRKVDKRRSAAAPVRRLFEYFFKMRKIHRNRCNAVVSLQWEFIFINSDFFSVQSECILMLFHSVFFSKSSRSSVLA